jgi:hypothetical protein
VSERDVPEKIVSTASRTAKIISDLMLTSRLTYFTGPFINSGPIPPRAEKETTYTVTWSITSTVNDTHDVVVKAALPTYVRWMNVVSPASEDISFNPVGGEVVWNVGEVEAHRGLINPPREVSFQLAFNPSLSHVGTAPEIIGETTLEGVDSFTDTLLRSAKKGLTTKLSTDPEFKSGDEKVVE